jgi:hypothetical protein
MSEEACPMDQRDEMRASIARLDAMLERAKGLPSLPDLARRSPRRSLLSRPGWRRWNKNVRRCASAN